MTGFDDIIVIPLLITFVLLPIKAGVLYWIFRADIETWWADRKARARPLTSPVCLYCQSTWTKALDEGQTRWDRDDLVLVTTYECQHCHLPFWHVERIPTSSLKT